MPNIRVTLETYRRLVELRRGMDNMNSVVSRLLAFYEDSLITQVDPRYYISPPSSSPEEKQP